MKKVFILFVCAATLTVGCTKEGSESNLLELPDNLYALKVEVAPSLEEINSSTDAGNQTRIHQKNKEYENH